MAQSFSISATFRCHLHDFAKKRRIERGGNEDGTTLFLLPFFFYFEEGRVEKELSGKGVLNYQEIERSPLSIYFLPLESTTAQLWMKCLGQWMKKRKVFQVWYWSMLSPVLPGFHSVVVFHLVVEELKRKMEKRKVTRQCHLAGIFFPHYKNQIKNLSRRGIHKWLFNFNQNYFAADR